MRDNPVSQCDREIETGNSSDTWGVNNPGLRVTRTVSPGLNDFHPNDPDGIDSKLLQVLHKRNSSSGVSSLILDNGDGQQLSDKAEEREGVLFAPSSELFQTGAQFSPGSARSIRSKISDFSDAEDHDAPPLQQPHVEAPTRDLHRTLQEAISEARLESIEKDGRFLPLNSLGSLVTLKSIEEELRQYNLADDLRTIAKDVLRIKPGTQSNDPTTRRKIFAILVMMRRSGAIVDVIKEKIWDDALPFRIGKSSQQDVHRKAQDGTTPEPIAFFRKWKIDERETFDNYQWQMTAPYFRLGFRPRKKVHHYDLEPRAVLPFVEETPKDDSLNHSVDFSGGTSTVRKLKIHSAHHDCPKELPSRDTNPYFAVKTLRLREEIAKEKGKGKEVNREALALKRFVDKDHKHLIRLLATFTYKDQFNFILPCADGNLQDLWKKHYPKLSDLPRDRELARWVAGQLLGLAYAVKSIHMAPVDAPNSGNLSEEDRAKQHGRHGDLKPENILWFKDSSSQSGQSAMGVLKISDFGFADFHRTHSVNIISLSSIGGVTPTYRAPECDLAPNAPKGSSVSPAYDIWSFGCVFLEFVNWYLLGWKGVDNFSKRRKEESDSLVEEDNFFNSSDKGRTAKSKPSVAENFRTLKEHPDCSDFLLDLLDHIQDKMLRMRPQRRATCDEIVAQLEQIVAYCEEHPTYCTERIKEIRPTPTDLSEVTIYSLPEPGQLKDHINYVNATTVLESSTHEQDDDRTFAQNPSCTSDGESIEASSERTPLLDDGDPRVRSKLSKAESKGYAASISQGTAKWVRGIAKACCCLSGDE